LFRAIVRHTAPDCAAALTSAARRSDNLGMDAGGPAPDERFEIIRELGKGAGGTTYEAVDRRDGTRVALKCLEVGRVHDWKTVELFEREAKVLAALDHPGIPKHRDAFPVEGASGTTLYLARELAPGLTLRQWLTQHGPISEQEIVRVVDAVLDILMYLHSFSPPVVHRDVKPENVIRGEDGRVWLVDFGAVRDAATTTTGGSTVVGTYGYMAPEQFRGHAVPSSDIYGLGATALYLLTGLAPTDLPQRELAVDFARVPGGSPRLRAWLARAMEPIPEKRFRTAVEARRALHGPMPASPSAPEKRTGRGRLVALALALVTVCGAAGGVAVYELRAAHAEKTAKAKKVKKKRVSSDALAPQPRGPLDTLVLDKHRVVHTNVVTAMEATPDGAAVVTACDNVARLVDAKTLEVVRTFGPEPLRVAAVGLSPDGKELYTVGARIAAWELATGKQLRASEPAHGGGAYALRVSKDGRTLFTSGGDGAVKTWDAATLAHKSTLQHGTQRLSELALSPDGKTLASAGKDGDLKLWDADTGALLSTTHAHESDVDDIAFSPDGTLIATSGDDHAVRTWVLRDRGVLLVGHTLLFHTDEAWGVSFGPDGRTLVSVGKDKTLAVWDPRSGQLLEEQSTGTMTSKVAYVADGTRLVVAAGVELVLLRTPRRGLGLELPAVPASAGVERAVPAGRVSRLTAEAQREIDKIPLGSLELASTKLAEALRDDPQNADARALMALIHFHRGYESGRTYKESAITSARAELDRVPVAARTSRWWTIDAHIAAGAKDWPRARASAERAETLAPGDARVLIARARIDIDEGQYTLAKQRLERAIAAAKDGPTVRTAFAYLPSVYGGLGDLDAEDAAHKRIVALAPDNPWAHGNYAYFLVHRANDPERAIEAARHALSLMEYGSARAALAAAYASRGERELWRTKPDASSARASFDESLAAKPDYRRGLYGRAATLRYLGVTTGQRALLDEAAKDLERLAKLDPKDSRVRQARAELEALRAR
jgi:tetratricopeptide (TPR) repeat protein